MVNVYDGYLQLINPVRIKLSYPCFENASFSRREHIL